MLRTLTRTTVLALVMMCTALPALALDLQQARSQGLVGEQMSGYVAAVKPSEGVKQLVADVNARRLQEYKRISKENGQAIELVGRLAAKQIIEKLPKGSLYQDAGGKWQAR